MRLGTTGATFGLILVFLFGACDAGAQDGKSTRSSGNADSVKPMTPTVPRPVPRRVVPPTPRPRKATLTIGLEVSKDISKELLLLEQERYTEVELGPLFASMRKASAPICATLWKYKKPKREVAAKFIRKKAIWKFRCAICRRGLVSGCWNFFLMNDRAVDLDFQLVRHLYRKQGPFDCYSVSFIQPYMMHAELGCKTLTLIDIDWRILDAHVQLLQQFRAGGLETLDGLDKALAKLDIGWVAYGGKMTPRFSVGRHTLCQKHGQKELCPKYLPAFQRRFAELKTVRLRLSALHDASFDTAKEPLPKIVFVSNAVESAYTRWGEFRQLLRRATKSLRPGQKLVFIHHIAEFKGRAIYELTRKGKTSELRTVCRDRLILTGRKRRKFIALQTHVPTANGNYYRRGTRDPEEAFAPHPRLLYFTHFDVVSRNRNSAPRCVDLLRRMDEANRKPLRPSPRPQPKKSSP